VSPDPQFSVVIPVFNSELLIERSVRSVLDGQFDDTELLVVDDGSTDGSAEVLSTIVDPRLRVIRQENRGRTAARNRGAAEGRGRFVTFLDSDDFVEPGWLAKMHALSQDLPSCGVVCCGARQATLDGNRQLIKESVIVPVDLGPVYHHQVARFAAGTFAVRRDLFDRIGGYEESLAHAENTELAHRLIAQLVREHLTIASTSEILVHYERCRPRLTGSDHRARLHAAETILARHGERYRRYGGPNRRFNYFSIAGVSSAHLGDLPAARRYFALAIRDAPTRTTGYGRLAAAMIPPVARRTWNVCD
jgi:glycosyltransferase involved in cell wall biosynthesis